MFSVSCSQFRFTRNKLAVKTWTLRLSKVFKSMKRGWSFRNKNTQNAQETPVAWGISSVSAQNHKRKSPCNSYALSGSLKISKEVFGNSRHAFAEHSYCLPVSVSHHDYKIVGVCIPSGDGDWKARCVDIEKKACQDGSLWYVANGNLFSGSFQNQQKSLKKSINKKVKPSFLLMSITHTVSQHSVIRTKIFFFRPPRSKFNPCPLRTRTHISAGSSTRLANAGTRNPCAEV